MLTEQRDALEQQLIVKAGTLCNDARYEGIQTAAMLAFAAAWLRIASVVETASKTGVT